MIIRRSNAKVSDPMLPCPALVVLRDKYRKLAIRTWERFAKLSKRPSTKISLGFQSRRDYYVGAAEAIDALIPQVQEPVVPEQALSPVPQVAGSEDTAPDL